MKNINKVAIITGVTGGVGQAAAKSFIKKGWIVIGLSRNKDKLQKLKLVIDNNNFMYFIIDIRKYSSIKKVFSKINSLFGRIDLLINNASIFKKNKIQKITHADINNIIDTNLKGTIFCTIECAKVMKKGRIINVASVSGTHGIEDQSIYCASKYGVNGFAEAINQELIKDGIKISTIMPGGIDTPLWNSNNKYDGDVNKILKPTDIVKVMQYIANLPDNVILKNIILFPSCEWH